MSMPKGGKWVIVFVNSENHVSVVGLFGTHGAAWAEMDRLTTKYPKRYKGAKITRVMPRERQRRSRAKGNETTE